MAVVLQGPLSTPQRISLLGIHHVLQGVMFMSTCLMSWNILEPLKLSSELSYWPLEVDMAFNVSLNMIRFSRISETLHSIRWIS